MSIKTEALESMELFLAMTPEAQAENIEQGIAELDTLSNQELRRLMQVEAASIEMGFAAADAAATALHSADEPLAERALRGQAVKGLATLLREAAKRIA